MRRRIRYKCEYCGKEMANKFECIEHEKHCRDIKEQEQRFVRLVSALIDHYRKQGFHIYIRVDETYPEYLISVVYRGNTKG